MSARSLSWASKTPKAGTRSLRGAAISPACASEWERLTRLAAAAKHPAARAFLIDQRARLLKRAT
jgi:hypothetical protein